MFSESLSSDDGNDQYEDKYKDKDTETQKQTKTKCFQDPMYAIFFKSRGSKDLIYHINCLLVTTNTRQIQRQ